MNEYTEQFAEYDQQRDELFAIIQDLVLKGKVIPQVVAAMAGKLLVFALADVYYETGDEVIVPIMSGLLRQYWQLKIEIDEDEDLKDKADYDH